MVALEASKLLKDLSPEQLAAIRAQATELSFDRGASIFREGDPGDGVYIVKSGAVQISTMLATGQPLVFARVAPGEAFGEMAVLDDQPRSASASAEADTVVYFLPRQKLFELLKEVPRLATSLLHEISSRLREFNRQYLRTVLQAERTALVGRFASSIVHDLKNPLTIIDMAAALGCAADAKPEIQAEARERIHKQVERITHLVNDVLEFTRGTPTALKFSNENYRHFIKAFVDEVAPEAKAQGIELRLEKEAPDIVVPMNAQRLSRVIHNLVANAIDVLPGGGVIRFNFETNDPHITTHVEDSGKGIAPEIAGHLFEPFATYGKRRGTGLGLSICQRIIEEHGGTISARNSPRGGAVFTFALPRQQSAQAPPKT